MTDEASGPSRWALLLCAFAASCASPGDESKGQVSNVAPGSATLFNEPSPVDGSTATVSSSGVDSTNLESPTLATDSAAEDSAVEDPFAGTTEPASGVSDGRPASDTSGNGQSSTAAATEPSSANSGFTSDGDLGRLADFTCPPGPYALRPITPDVSVQRVDNVPPNDGFATETALVILEGPVWLDGNLYLSQINNSASSINGDVNSSTVGSSTGEVQDGGGGPLARVLKVTAESQVSVVMEDTGSNGLAIDANGSLVAASHKHGSIVLLGLEPESVVELVSTYADRRFNSPNDLTFGADGTLYFTDPDYQAPMPRPQANTRAYRVPPGTTTAIPFAEDVTQPNGVTLSPDRTVLYLATANGVFAYPVMADGSLGARVAFASSVVDQSDGMAADCAGNLYTTSNQSVIIVSPEGNEVGRLLVPDVQSVTNVAFGGVDNRTIFITSLGQRERAALFRVTGEVPGMPY